MGLLFHLHLHLLCSRSSQILLDRDSLFSLLDAMLVRSINIRKGTSTWCNYYISDYNTYPEKLFRRLFGVPRALFWRLHTDMVAVDSEFWGKRNVVGGSKGIDSHVKVLACLRLLRTGKACYRLDDRAWMAEETLRLHLKRFTTVVLKFYVQFYMNKWPSFQELETRKQTTVMQVFSDLLGPLTAWSLSA